MSVIYKVDQREFIQAVGGSMEEDLRNVIERVIGESVQRSIEPFIRALLKSIKIIRDEVASIGVELETRSKDLLSQLNGLSNLLRTIYEHVERIEKTQGEAEQRLLITPPSEQRNVESLVESKVRSLIEPLGKTLQKIVDQQITLINTIEQIVGKMESIERSMLELKTSAPKIPIQLGSEVDEEERAETTSDVFKSEVFSKLEGAVKTLLEKTEEAEKVKETEEAEGGPEFEEHLTETEKLELQSASREAAGSEELTIDKLQERVAEIDREITDLTFDRMRGLLSEEEYQEKKETLIKEKEILKKKIEELTLKM